MLYGTLSALVQGGYVYGYWYGRRLEYGDEIPEEFQAYAE